GEALEIVREHLLLGADLRGRFEMLHGTAAAGAEMHAAGFDAVRGGILHRQRLALVEAAAFLQAQEAHGLARQRATDEHRLAVDARHAATVMAEVLDDGGEFLANRAHMASQASRYSLKCGRFSARR